ncbi:MAG: hypothetical protein M1608_10520 [Candidatus Omnitrophica bacterium]|nr:hypothetical protein [Candidatus Omnitrophota bacterium]
MDKRIFGISWLNGRFKAMALNKWSIVGTWVCPEPVRDTDNLVPVLQKAVRQTGYNGFKVAMILAHPRLTQQLVEIPPISGRDLELFLTRRANQFKTFEDDAVWSYRRTSPTKGAEGVLLHIMPKLLLNTTVDQCHQAELHLIKLFPALSILSGQLPELPLEPEEVALLAGETEGYTSFVIGPKAGPVLLGRSLSTSWRQDPERVITEINRTILFVKQQFGQAINSAWLFGEQAESFSMAIALPMDVPGKMSPVKPRPFYWVEEGVKLGSKDAENLVSKELQRAPQRRLLLQITSLMVAVLTLASLSLSAYVEALVRNYQRTYQNLETRETALQARKLSLERSLAELAGRKKLAQFVLEENLPPVPGWFLAYVAGGLPEQLILSELTVKRAEASWSFRLAGSILPAANPAPTNHANSNGALEAFEAQLKQGPFHVRITRSSNQVESPAKAGTPMPPSLKNPISQETGSSRGAGKEDQASFFIEGVMR